MTGDLKNARFVVHSMAWATALWLGRLSVEDYAEAIVSWTSKGWRAEAST